MGVLAVAQDLGALEGQVQGPGQDGGQRRLLEVGVGDPVERLHRAGALAVEPGDDGRVVGGGVGEGGPGQPATGGRAQRAGATQLLQDDGVVGGRGDHPDVLVVLGRGPHHGGTRRRR